MESVRDALDAAWRGELAHFDALVATFPADVAAAFRAHRALIAGDVVPPSVIDGSPLARGIAAIAAGRSALLQWNPHETRLAAEALSASPFPTWGLAMHAWTAVLGGDALPDGLDVKADGDAALAIELMTLRAWDALFRRDLSSAVRDARRASRMGRTESLPRQEYLANVLLARVRRMTGAPHRAARILSALRRVAPPSWHHWLDWELRIAGGPGAGVGRLIDAWLGATAQGDSDRAGRALVAARSVVHYCAPSRDDLEDLIALIADNAAEAAVARMAPFASGAEHASPSGVESAVFSGRDAVAWVLAMPPRRVLRPALGLYDGPTIETASRTDKSICTLALSGDAGIELETFFEAVYGFAFKKEIHDGALRVLLHRTRDAVEAYADVERVDDRLFLRVRAAFAVPDPRVQVGDGVLRLLAEHPGLGVREVAERLGLPHRTVQNQMRQLVQDGVCTATKHGRRVAYSVEDTTFAEPTRV